MALTKSELQNAADAAALAGADKLADNYVLYNLAGQTTDDKKQLVTGAINTVKATAKTYAAYNSAGGVASLSLLDSDIDVGFTDSKGIFKSSSTDTTYYPNTVKVVMRRDASANSPLALFFAPVIGMDNLNVNASAGATLYGGTINSFKSSTAKSVILPLTYDVNDWNAFLASARSDGKITKDAKQPLAGRLSQHQETGNFGLLSLNDSHVGQLHVELDSKRRSRGRHTSPINNKLVPISATQRPGTGTAKTASSPTTSWTSIRSPARPTFCPCSRLSVKFLMRPARARLELQLQHSSVCRRQDHAIVGH